MFEALSFMKKKLGFPELKVKWVFDFFLGDFTKTRENALSLPPPSAMPPSANPAVERAKQYLNKQKASEDAGNDLEEEDQEDNEDNLDPNEEVEGIGVDGAPPAKVTLADFDLIRVLGRGAFGKVVQIRKKDTESFSL